MSMKSTTMMPPMSRSRSCFAISRAASRFVFRIVCSGSFFPFPVKRPVFTLVVVATIALGIGVNAGIFSVLYDVVLEPLPYESPDELVMVWEHNVPRDNRTNVVAPANFYVWRDDTELFSDLAAVTWFSQTLTGTEDAQRVGALAAAATT